MNNILDITLFSDNELLNQAIIEKDWSFNDTEIAFMVYKSNRLWNKRAQTLNVIASKTTNTNLKKDILHLLDKADKIIKNFKRKSPNAMYEVYDYASENYYYFSTLDNVYAFIKYQEGNPRFNVKKLYKKKSSDLELMLNKNCEIIEIVSDLEDYACDDDSMFIVPQHEESVRGYMPFFDCYVEYPSFGSELDILQEGGQYSNEEINYIFLASQKVQEESNAHHKKLKKQHPDLGFDSYDNCILQPILDENGELIIESSDFHLPLNYHHINFADIRDADKRNEYLIIKDLIAKNK